MNIPPPLRLMFLLLAAVPALMPTGRTEEIVLSLPPHLAGNAAPDAVASDLMPFKIFNFSVHSLAFSPDGMTLATGDGYGDLRLWDVTQGTLRARTNAHQGWLFSLAWLGDNRRVVTGGKDRLIRLHEPGAPWRILQTFVGHTSDVHAVAFTPDESMLASAGDDRTVRIWNTASGSLRQTLSGHARQIPTVAVSPDGRLLASGSRDRSIRLWELASGRELARLTNHAADVMSVRFSPDGRTLASGSYDQTVRLWDASTFTPSQVLTGHTYRVYCVAFHPDGKLLASAGDRSARIWDTATGRLVRSYLVEGQILQGLQSVPGSVSAVAFSPDGKRLAIATTLGIVLLVATDSGKVLHTLDPAPR